MAGIISRFWVEKTLQDGDYEPTFEFVIQPATNEEVTINADYEFLALKLQALLISETYPYRRWKRRL